MKEIKTCQILNVWLCFIFILNQTFPYLKCDLNIQPVLGITVYLLMKRNCLTGSFPALHSCPHYTASVNRNMRHNVLT